MKLGEDRYRDREKRRAWIREYQKKRLAYKAAWRRAQRQAKPDEVRAKARAYWATLGGADNWRRNNRELMNARERVRTRALRRRQLRQVYGGVQDAAGG